MIQSSINRKSVTNTLIWFYCVVRVQDGPHRFTVSRLPTYRSIQRVVYIYDRGVKVVEPLLRVMDVS